MITEDYVSFETAKLLKEKGFKIPYDSFRGVYINGIFKRLNPGDGYGYNLGDEIVDVCSLQMAMKWLREEKDVQIEIAIVGTDTWESPTKWMYGFRCQTKDVIDRRNADFSSYEQACEAGIKYCLKKLI